MAQTGELRRLLKSLRRIVRALDMHSRRIDREIGLTLPQLVVLQCIRDLGEVTGRAISEEADLSPPTVVGVLDKLEAKGLIQRYRSARDRRIVHTRLTDRGALALAASPSPLGERFEARFMALPAPERRALLDALAGLAALTGPEAGPDAEPLAASPFSDAEPEGWSRC